MAEWRLASSRPSLLVILNTPHAPMYRPCDLREVYASTLVTVHALICQVTWTMFLDGETRLAVSALPNHRAFGQPLFGLSNHGFVDVV